MGNTFRIYTENKNLHRVEKIISKYFQGFTVYKATGHWRLQQENSLIIEILGESSIIDKVNRLAKEIKKANKQEAVLIQKIKNNSWII